MLADKACGRNTLCTLIASMGADAVIPSNRCRKVAIPRNTSSANTETVSGDASTSSNTSAGLAPDTADERSTSPASWTSLPP